MRLAETLVPDPAARKPFQQICGFARKCGAKTVLIHRNVELSNDYRRARSPYRPMKIELADLRKHFADFAASITQVTFFSTRISKNSTSLPDRVKARDVLSTCLVVTVTGTPRPRSGIKVPRTYVFEAVVAFPSVPFSKRNKTLAELADLFEIPAREGLLNNYYHVGSRIGIIVAARKFTVKAAYFCQQNQINGWCGHATMKMALWNVSKFKSAERVTNEAINKAIAAARQLAKEPRYQGSRPTFTLHDIEAVCKEYGVKTVSYRCKKNPSINPYEFAYLLIESGIPAIIAFVTSPSPNGQGTCHVLPIIGHTMNSDEWFPGALSRYKLSRQGLRGGNHKRYLSTVEWVPHLIAHDDLLGPYLCIKAGAFPNKVGPAERGEIQAIIGLVAGDVPSFDIPYVAQDVAAEAFNGYHTTLLEGVKGVWGERLRAMSWNETELVLRTQIIEKKNYIAHLKHDRDHEGRQSGLDKQAEAILDRELLPTMWMSEITIPDLYTANKRKLGEILLPLKLSLAHVRALDIGYGPAPILFRMIDRVILYGKKSFSLSWGSHTDLYKRVSIDVEF
jgi:hypothetical protein